MIHKLEETVFYDPDSHFEYRATKVTRYDSGAEHLNRAEFYLFIKYLKSNEQSSIPLNNEKEYRIVADVLSSADMPGHSVDFGLLDLGYEGLAAEVRKNEVYLYAEYDA